MNILAIDQATKTGWCLNGTIYGEWDFNTKKDEDDGMKLIRFRAKIKEIHNETPLDMIAFETPVNRFANAIMLSSKLLAVIIMFCKDNNISYKGFPPAEIKKSATGNGSSNKDAMVAAAKEKYGYTGSSDNTADAIHLYYMVQKLYDF